jgi:hypothetical protein
MSLNVFLFTSKISTHCRPAYEHVTYPGSFNVLFIEYAKCFPTEVNRSGR